MVYTICDFSGFFDFFNFVFLVMCKAKISQLKNFFCLIKKFVRRYFHRFIYPTVKNWIFVIGIFFVPGIKIQYFTKIVNFCLKVFWNILSQGFLRRCWWQKWFCDNVILESVDMSKIGDYRATSMLVTKSVGDNFEMLVTDLAVFIINIHLSPTSKQLSLPSLSPT